MNGKFYGLGVGPGDPELVTVKAVKVLNKADIIIAPETISGKGSVAYKIIKEHVEQQDKVKFQVFPMTYDADALDSTWNQNMEEIMLFLKQGKDVAFITLGDPMIYSTYIYVMRRIKAQGIEVETVPGIPSFCAAASRLGIPLSEGEETIAIIPAAYKCDHMDELLTYGDNVILMKPSRGFEDTVEKLDKHQLLQNTVMISKCGHADESITWDLKKMTGQKIDYLSMIIAKKRGTKE
ncbi:precorrin-2/cobalt-factor-2 C20-methyltransferase [Geosporobacter subterraneus DSM 17957]|uniref:Precorrin-2/cobalt-factor-2 C20-methyltransferase n=1 Tax=Geosporobacter subterraneus DSM 17957 TaxID=1121919 RepID=A0A1M6G4U1_9FIRM|nr:precorrin-2 C(20)-methyltransferase [Geosporobacter subterraneus]SHJ04910.1 precorrin-2/cobalt-factor-2 C20-methyltransferase [Geosporobacter subterraneus DSM 17957]